MSEQSRCPKCNSPAGDMMEMSDGRFFTCTNIDCIVMTYYPNGMVRQIKSDTGMKFIESAVYDADERAEELVRLIDARLIRTESDLRELNRLNFQMYERCISAIKNLLLKYGVIVRSKQEEREK